MCGLDLVSATDGSGIQNYYMYNGQSSVTNMVDYSGPEKAVYVYDPSLGGRGRPAGSPYGGRRWMGGASPCTTPSG